MPEADLANLKASFEQGIADSHQRLTELAAEQAGVEKEMDEHVAAHVAAIAAIKLKLSAKNTAAQQQRDYIEGALRDLEDVAKVHDLRVRYREMDEEGARQRVLREPYQQPYADALALARVSVVKVLALWNVVHGNGRPSTVSSHAILTRFWAV
jgi:ABC-type transporter Mla subunit MlaD